MKIRVNALLSRHERHVLDAGFELRFFLLDRIREDLDDKAYTKISKITNRGQSGDLTLLGIVEIRTVLNMINGAVKEEHKTVLAPMRDAPVDAVANGLIARPRDVVNMLIEIREKQGRQIDEAFILLLDVEKRLKLVQAAADLASDYDDEE